VHEVAREVNPGARVVYVDYDPVVVSHGRALLAVLHFLPNADDPTRAVACLQDAVVPGSYLAISRIGAEFFPGRAAMAAAKAVYERASEPIWARSRDQILGFFDGFELLEPGLVPKRQWRSVTGQAATDTPNIQWGAVE
jgi:S-adenosyl methyltransferase